MTADRNPNRPYLRRLLQEARPFWLHFVVLLVVSLLSIPLTLLLPLPVKILIDSVLGSTPLPRPLSALLPAGAAQNGNLALLLPAGMLVVILGLSKLQALLSTVLFSYTTERLMLSFRAKVFLHLQRLSLAHHDSKGSSDATYRIQYDAVSVAIVILGGGITFTTTALTLLGMIYVVARIDWQLLVVVAAVAPFLLLSTYVYRQLVRKRWHRVKELESAAMSVLQEALGAIRVVKAFQREEQERQRFVQTTMKGVRLRVKLAFAEGIFNLAVGLLIGAGTGLALYLGGLHVRSGRITLGALMMAVIYLVQLYAPMTTLAQKVGELQTALASVERSFSVLDEPQEVIEQPNARRLLHAAGRVEFRNVSFSYDGERPALQDVSFEVPSGTSLGIMGKTGAGKTTLINLLGRFYDPNAGEIRIDGIDTREYRLADLRDQFAFVLQDSVLFSASIAENIAYGRPQASQEEIEKGARAANAHDFIMELPEGYRTVLGERGMTVSGGERQRIALARAFLKDAPILILDEPTSSVDTKTEAVIMEAMERLMRGRTTLIIAHRLSTLKNCDNVLRLENGRVASLDLTVQDVAT